MAKQEGCFGLESFIGLVLLKRRAISLYVGTILVAGTWVAGQVPLEGVPSPPSSSVFVSAVWPSASPLAVEQYVTAPIERAVEGVAGTAKVTSFSLEGYAVLRLDLARNRDLGLYVAEVSDCLAALRRALPDSVVPMIDRAGPSTFPAEQEFMTLQLVSSVNPGRLRRMAEERVAQPLRGIPGIAGVAIEGGEEKELLVALDGERLRIHRLSAETVRDALRELLAKRSYGWLSSEQGQRMLTSFEDRNLRAIQRLPLKKAFSSHGTNLLLEDVARVTLGPAPVRGISRVDGKPVVTLVLNRRPESHAIETAEMIRERIESIRSGLPSDVRLLVADDRTLDLRVKLRRLALQGGLGLLATISMLCFLLGSRRAVGVVVSTVATALATAMLLLASLELSLNFVTLTGLALLCILLLANASSLLDRLLAQPRFLSYPEATAAALREVCRPQVGAMLALIGSFTLLACLKGEDQVVLGSLVAAIWLALPLALFNTFLLVPVLGKLLHPARTIERSGRRRSRRLMIPYYLASRYPKATLALLVITVGLPTPLVRSFLDESAEEGASTARQRLAESYSHVLNKSPLANNLFKGLGVLFGGVTRPFCETVEFGEGWDGEERSEVVVTLKLPSGNGMERSDSLIKNFERRALRWPSVRRTIARINEDMAVLRVLFHRDALSGEEPLAVRQDLIAQAASIAGLEVSVSGILPMGYFSGFGETSDLTVEALGPSYEGLQKVAADFAGNLQRHPGVTGVDIHASRFGQPGKKTLQLLWRSEAVARSGVSVHEAAALLRPHLLMFSPNFRASVAGVSHLPVRLVDSRAEDEDLNRLLERSLPAVGGRPIRLADFVEVRTERVPPVIERENQRYRRLIRIFFRGPQELGLQILDQEVRRSRLPPAYTLEHRERNLVRGSDHIEVLWGIVMVIGWVFLSMAVVLESWRMAASALLCVPMAWIGVALGFLMSRQTFSEGAVLGLALAVGFAIHSGSLLVDRYRSLRRLRLAGPGHKLALLAVRSRLRSLWLTTLTCMAGVLPVLVLPGPEALWKSLAVTVLGGLLSSALLTPLAMVALIAWRTGLPRAERLRGGAPPARAGRTRSTAM